MSAAAAHARGAQRGLGTSAPVGREVVVGAGHLWSCGRRGRLAEAALVTFCWRTRRSRLQDTLTGACVAENTLRYAFSLRSQSVCVAYA